jgi:excisionase family DNA binding protein
MIELYDKTAAAKILGVSRASVDRYRVTGKLPYRRFGDLVKFTQEDIDTFIKNSAEGGEDGGTK